MPELNGAQFGYHISRDTNRDSIAEHGLTLDHSSDGKHIWMFSDRSLAEEHLKTTFRPTQNMHGQTVGSDLYEVNLKGMRTTKDPHVIAASMQGRVVKKPISPDRVRRLT